MIDIVTVIHNDTNREQAELLREQIVRFHEGTKDWNFIVRDNSQDNIGFAAGCNWGAFKAEYTRHPYIGFINPDCTVTGPFFQKIDRVFSTDKKCVITGSKFNKPKFEIHHWGLRDWVCGAAFFVRRDWFERVDGFDEGYVWAWEETDLIREAVASGLKCKSILLPIEHASPTEDTTEDARYKRENFELGRRRFERKWSHAK